MAQQTIGTAETHHDKFGRQIRVRKRGHYFSGSQVGLVAPKFEIRPGQLGERLAKPTRRGGWFTVASAVVKRDRH
jgi:hypothetical protein